MAQPRFLRDGNIYVLDELRRWRAAQPDDAVDTVAKLFAIAKYGMGLIGLFSTDTYDPPDLFCRQRNGWACFYVAKPLPGAGAEVVALLCAQVIPGSLGWLQQEVVNRRALSQV